MTRNDIFRLAAALLAISLTASSGASLCSAQDDSPEGNYREKVVYSGPDVIFRQIDEHTWEGNGHLCYNESIYIVEGSERALLIDAGTKIANLDEIVAGITEKPVTLVATHVHPDHTGSAVNLFDEIWINAADMVNVESIMKDYPGRIRYLSDGTFFDRKARYGFSGDAFGSTNLLLSTNFSTLICTTSRIAEYMEKYGITRLYPGHYHGDNPETLQRVRDLNRMVREVLSGEREGKYEEGMLGLNAAVTDFGVTIRYNYPGGVK